jgi:molybdate transport system substrate-binding protein
MYVLILLKHYHYDNEIFVVRKNDFFLKILGQVTYLPNSRGMSMNKGIIIAITLIILASTLCGCIGDQETTPEEPSVKLLVYSGAGLRESMDGLAEGFEQEHGIKVEITYGGAAQLLSQIELAGEGDVFIPGGRPIFDKAKEKGFIEYEHFVAYHIPVIGVPKGNPGNITCIADLARPGVEVALGDAKAVPIGKAANKILEKAGIADDVNIVTRAGTEPELVAMLATRSADAAIFWKSSLIEAEDKIGIIEIPKEENAIKIIPVGVLKFSDNKDAAKDFVHFVISDRGKAIWGQNGYVMYPNEEYGIVE